VEWGIIPFLYERKNWMVHNHFNQNWILRITALGLLAFIAAVAFPGLSGNVALAQSAGAPELVYETILNGAQFDQGIDMAVNAAGEVFLLARAYDTSNDVMVVKLSASGDVLFTKYLRGSAHDYGTGIAVDAAGDVYVGGWTDSADFPILNAIQLVKNGTRDAFIAKLSGNDGSLIFSTFFAGSQCWWHLGCLRQSSIGKRRPPGLQHLSRWQLL
jgi:hypothetical protein